ncbi:MAG TPA: response regulator transcription factor [Rariglobus sp.]|jgi:DNA-binding response OmpR family regulator|nr:response regulator transcription factor [Rariglobus sp.]
MRAEPKPLILVVEDEEELAKLICLHLEEAGMQTQVYNRCALALRFLKKNFANLLLLDVNLPDQSGFALLEELKNADIPIPTIFLTGNALEVNKVRGFELGGDDYITKPFGFPELVARIRAVLRRAESTTDMNLTKNVRVVDEPFELCGARVIPIRLEIEFPGGKSEKIGRKELGILAHIHENRGAVITRKALIHAVWGIHADVKSRSLDQYIVKVRELFKRHRLSLDSFRTVHGVGYIFEAEDPLSTKA